MEAGKWQSLTHSLCFRGRWGGVGAGKVIVQVLSDLPCCFGIFEGRYPVELESKDAAVTDHVTWTLPVPTLLHQSRAQANAQTELFCSVPQGCPALVPGWYLLGKQNVNYGSAWPFGVV